MPCKYLECPAGYARTAFLSCVFNTTKRHIIENKVSARLSSLGYPVAGTLGRVIERTREWEAESGDVAYIMFHDTCGCSSSNHEARSVTA